MIGCLQRFCERPSIITVQLVVRRHLLFRKIAQIHGIQLFLKGTVRYGGHDHLLQLIMENVEKINDLSRRCLVDNRRLAVQPLAFGCGVRPSYSMHSTVSPLGDAPPYAASSPSHHTFHRADHR